MASDSRQAALAHWITQIQPGHAHPPPLSALGGDAGFRRYFRYPWPTPLLAVDAPPSSEDTRQFVALANYLRQQGLRSPHIVAADANLGFLLVEDLGEQLLYPLLTPTTADTLYGLAINRLHRLQTSPDHPTLIPRYDRPLLRRELELFSDWFVGALLGHALTDSEQQQLGQLFTQLEDSALQQPQVLVHRDYHSRNLLLCSDGELGIIDFQGALWGPLTYDLVSLLKDCYRRWPVSDIERWTQSYYQQLPHPPSYATFKRWFDWMGLQRHIKVLGIFARLHLRDGKTSYLQDLPLVIRYCLETADAYAELHPFAQWFRQTLLPKVESHSWYRDYRDAGETTL